MNYQDDRFSKGKFRDLQGRAFNGIGTMGHRLTFKADDLLSDALALVADFILRPGTPFNRHATLAFLAKL